MVNFLIMYNDAGGKKEPTMVKKCDCKHEGQDELHGKGNRVHNETKKGKDSAKMYRCTVCSKERP